MTEKEKYIDNPSKHLLRTIDVMHKSLPAVIILLFVYVGVKLFTDIKHPVLSVIEPALIGYFVVELFVLHHLYNCRRQFLRDKWVNILLLLPFLSVFRVVGFNAKAIQSVPKGVKLLHKSALIRKVGHGIVDLPKAKKIVEKMNMRVGKKFIKRIFRIE